ncbi:MAG: hypothetical protein P8Y35_08660 [Sulfurovaceae bacterium]
MYHHIIKIIIAGFIIIVPMYAKDIPASKDHPMIKRYKDSEIKGYDVATWKSCT